jgi:hypothetical protein
MGKALPGVVILAFNTSTAAPAIGDEISRRGGWVSSQRDSGPAVKEPRLGSQLVRFHAPSSAT